MRNDNQRYPVLSMPLAAQIPVAILDHPAFIKVDVDTSGHPTPAQISECIYKNNPYVKNTGRAVDPRTKVSIVTSSCSPEFINQVKMLFSELQDLSKENAELNIFFDRGAYGDLGLSYEDRFMISLLDANYHNYALGLYSKASNEVLVLMKQMLERLYYFYAVLKHKAPQKAKSIASDLTGKEIAVCGPGAFEKIKMIDGKLYGKASGLNDWLGTLRESTIEAIASITIAERKRNGIETSVGYEIHVQTELKLKARHEWGLHLPSEDLQARDEHARVLSSDDQKYALSKFLQSYSENAVEYVFNELLMSVRTAFRDFVASKGTTKLSADDIMEFQNLPMIQQIAKDFSIDITYFLKADNEEDPSEYELDVSEARVLPVVLSTFADHRLLNPHDYVCLDAEKGQYLLHYDNKAHLFDRSTQQLHTASSIFNDAYNGMQPMAAVVSLFSPAALQTMKAAATAEVETSTWVRDFQAILFLPAITEANLNAHLAVIAYPTETLIQLYSHYAAAESKRTVCEALVRRADTGSTKDLQTILLFLLKSEENHHYFSRVFNKVENEARINATLLVKLASACQHKTQLKLIAHHPQFIQAIGSRSFDLGRIIPVLKDMGSAAITHFLRTNLRAIKLQFGLFKKESDLRVFLRDWTITPEDLEENASVFLEKLLEMTDFSKSVACVNLFLETYPHVRMNLSDDVIRREGHAERIVRSGLGRSENAIHAVFDADKGQCVQILRAIESSHPNYPAAQSFLRLKCVFDFEFENSKTPAEYLPLVDSDYFHEAQATVILSRYSSRRHSVSESPDTTGLPALLEKLSPRIESESALIDLFSAVTIYAPELIGKLTFPNARHPLALLMSGTDLDTEDRAWFEAQYAADKTWCKTTDAVAVLAHGNIPAFERKYATNQFPSCSVDFIEVRIKDATFVWDEEAIGAALRNSGITFEVMIAIYARNRAAAEKPCGQWLSCHPLDSDELKQLQIPLIIAMLDAATHASLHISAENLKFIYRNDANVILKMMHYYVSTRGADRYYSFISDMAKNTHISTATWIQLASMGKRTNDPVHVGNTHGYYDSGLLHLVAIKEKFMNESAGGFRSLQPADRAALIAALQSNPEAHKETQAIIRAVPDYENTGITLTQQQALDRIPSATSGDEMFDILYQSRDANGYVDPTVAAALLTSPDLTVLECAKWIPYFDRAILQLVAKKYSAAPQKESEQVFMAIANYSAAKKISVPKQGSLYTQPKAQRKPETKGSKPTNAQQLKNHILNALNDYINRRTGKFTAGLFGGKGNDAITGFKVADAVKLRADIALATTPEQCRTLIDASIKNNKGFVAGTLYRQGDYGSTLNTALDSVKSLTKHS